MYSARKVLHPEQAKKGGDFFTQKEVSQVIGKAGSTKEGVHLDPIASAIFVDQWREEVKE